MKKRSGGESLGGFGPAAAHGEEERDGGENADGEQRAPGSAALAISHLAGKKQTYPDAKHHAGAGDEDDLGNG
jgi:hypothetical protein